MDRVRESVTALEDTVAPPRKNGELVFEAPWESRAFGMAVALEGAEAYTWEEFSARLAAQIAADGEPSSGDAAVPVTPGAEAEYYEQWLEALETLLTEKGLLSYEEIETRTSEYAAGLWDHEH